MYTIRAQLDSTWPNSSLFSFYAKSSLTTHFHLHSTLLHQHNCTEVNSVNLTQLYDNSTQRDPTTILYHHNSTPPSQLDSTWQSSTQYTLTSQPLLNFTSVPSQLDSTRLNTLPSRRRMSPQPKNRRKAFDHVTFVVLQSDDLRGSDSVCVYWAKLHILHFTCPDLLFFVESFSFFCSSEVFSTPLQYEMILLLRLKRITYSV